MGQTSGRKRAEVLKNAKSGEKSVKQHFGHGVSVAFSFGLVLTAAHRQHDRPDEVLARKPLIFHEEAERRSLYSTSLSFLLESCRGTGVHVYIGGVGGALEALEVLRLRPPSGRNDAGALA